MNTTVRVVGMVATSTYYSAVIFIFVIIHVDNDNFCVNISDLYAY